MTGTPRPAFHFRGTHRQSKVPYSPPALWTTLKRYSSSIYSWRSDTSTIVSLDDNDTRTYPIPDLPVHVLRLIFEFAVLHGHPTELACSHVSTRWRTVALSTPSMWSVIDMKAYPSHGLEMFRTYLQRSGDALLDIRITLSQESYEHEGYALLVAIEACVHRWRWLSLQADFADANKILSSRFAPLCPPHLESLSVICLNTLDRPESPVEPEPTGPFRQRIFLGGAPQLSTLRIQNPELGWLQPPLAFITTLHLEDYRYGPMSFGRFALLISSVPALTHLSMYGNFVSAWSGIIHLPQLVSLRTSSNEQLGPFLLGLSAPNLHSLVIRDLAEHHMKPFWGGPKFPALRHLTLNKILVSNITLTRFAREFPAVTHLTLINFDADEFISVLTLPDDATLTQPRFPLLNTLTLHTLASVCPKDLLANLFAARTAACAPLRTLRLHSSLGGAAPSETTKCVSRPDTALQVYIWERCASWPDEEAPRDLDGVFLRLRTPPVVLVNPPAKASSVRKAKLRLWVK
ncbi:hypothetical protein BD779DRAFT_1669382 [Infundibulicybe gibba]|nr:hypothetical protein BD779DRAFT_1669382 [Infundibulicybe gibba]